MQSFLLVSDLTDFSDDSAAGVGLRSAADVLVLDLAGPGAHAGDADAAYTFIRASRTLPVRPRLYARIPVLDDPAAITILDAAIGAGAEGIVLPNALGGHDVTRLDARISVEEAIHAIDHGSVRIIAEAASTARAAMDLATFRGASHRLSGLIWSADRLASDLGGISTRTPDGALRAPLAWARGHFLIAAAAANVAAIVDITAAWPADSLHARLRDNRDDGFGGAVTRHADELADIAAIMGKSRV
jgi:citrate lyase subunit beta/citryl-CoA lyase